MIIRNIRFMKQRDNEKNGRIVEKIKAFFRILAGKRKSAYSLTGLCVRCMVIYTLIILLAYQMSARFSEYVWDQGFPDASDILNQTAIIASDDYEKLPQRLLRTGSFIVYGADGEMIYASDKDIEVFITAGDLEYIPGEYSEDIYSIEKYEDDVIWVLKERFDDQQNAYVISSYAILDSNYEVMYGDLFKEERVTQKQLELMQGYTSDGRILQRYDYENGQGQARIMIYVSNFWSDAQIDQAQMKQNLGNTVIYLFTFIGMIAIAFAIARHVRKSMQPLTDAIDEYRRTGIYNDQLVLPKEFRYVSKSMYNLTHQLADTEEKRLQEVKDKNRMIMDLSHDLKTPLTVIQGYAQALESHKVPEESIDRYLKVLRRKSDQSVTMINNLVKYSSLEHPDFKPDLQVHDLCELSRLCLAEMYEEIENEGMELDADMPDFPVFFKVDTKLYASIMENLISNSLKYNEPGTMLYFIMHIDGNEIVITFADNGVGIPKNLREDIFKLFVTGNEARTFSKGTGIGMSIVQRSVLLHGGKVSLLDTEGTQYGTAIEIRFPYSTELIIE